MRRKNSWCLGVIFIILLSSFVYANCDWGIGIISDNIFNSTDEFEFTIRVYKYHENKIKTNITYLRKIEDVYGNIVKEYNNLTCEATYDKNCKTNWPNLDPATYLIKGEIFPDCNDTDLENNFVEKLIAILKIEDFGIQDYSKIKINELFPDPQGYDNAAMPEGEWVELYNSGNETLDLENLGLKDNYGSNPDIFISDAKTIGGTIINPYSYLIVYMNGRSGFLNNDGFEKISLYKDDYLLDVVSYSGSTEGLTWGKIDDVWKLTLPTPFQENFYDETINESKIEIEKVYKDKIKFGDIVRVKVHVYKGDTEKYSIQAWIESENDTISKRSKASVYRKFTDYDLVLPIQVFSNCKEKYKDDEYELIVKGLGLRDEEYIKIEGNDESMCTVETIEKEIIKEIAPSITGLSEKDINTTYGIEYTSKEVKERRLAVYFFCVILIMMLIYFGLSKDE